MNETHVSRRSAEKRDASTGATSPYELLKRRLMRGQLLPGSVLTIRGLAKELGAGTMPVREALLRLEAQGALEMLESRSVRVPLQSLESFEQLCAVRVLLEGNAAASAARRATPIQVKQMIALNDRFEAAVAQADPIASLDANKRFHFAIYQAAGNATLVRQIELLWLQCGPYIAALFRYYALINEISNNSMSAGFGHRSLINAMAEKASAEARQGLEEDIEFSLSTFRRIIKKVGDSSQGIHGIIGLLPA